MLDQIGFGKFITMFKSAQKHSLAKRGVFFTVVQYFVLALDMCEKCLAEK